MNSTPTASRRTLPTLLIALVVLALVAYYFWPRDAGTAPDAAGPEAATVAPAAGAAGPSATASTDYGPLPPGAVSNVGGIPLDAKGNRILNEAGLPISNEPIPQAKPIPVKAPAGAVIGYTKDAAGNSVPLRAGDLKQIPNSPGTYAVVDMWADGGPTVVPATEGRRLTPAEAARMEAEEAARDAAASRRH